MKKLIFTLAIAVIVLGSVAQKTEDFFKEITSKFSDKPGFSASLIPSDMFDLYLKKKNVQENSPVFNTLKSLKSIMIVTQTENSKTFFNNYNPALMKEVEKEKDVTKTEVELFKMLANHYSEQNYTLFKTENNISEELKVFLKKGQGKTEALVLLTKSSFSTDLIELQGDIDLANVAELSDAFNLRTLEKLNKINGSSNVPMIRFQSDGKLKEIYELQKELSDKQRLNFEEQKFLTEEQKQKMEEKTKEMAEKYRQMAEKYQRFPIFLSYPGDSTTLYYINGKKALPKEIKELNRDDIKSIEVNKPTEANGKTSVKIRTK